MLSVPAKPGCFRDCGNLISGATRRHRGAADAPYEASLAARFQQCYGVNDPSERRFSVAMPGSLDSIHSSKAEAGATLPLTKRWLLAFDRQR